MQCGEFESVKNYWNNLSVEQKLLIVTEIKDQRTGTRYTSTGSNVLEKIAIFSCILWTENGRLFFIHSTQNGNTHHMAEYEKYLQEKFDELRKFFSRNSSNKELLELLLLQATQIIGLSMDKLFFFINKPESYEFVNITKKQLNKWLDRIEELLTRNIMWVDQDLSKTIGDALFSIHTLQSIITINFIVHDTRIDELKKNTISRALKILNQDSNTGPYYQWIAEANLELSLAKNAANNPQIWSEILSTISGLRNRFHMYISGHWKNSISLFGLDLPHDTSILSDDALEVISALLDFSLTDSVDDYIYFFHYILGNDQRWNYYSNERQQGFLLLIIEKLLQIFSEQSRAITVPQISIITRTLLQYIEKCPNWQILQEDLSRMFLKIANTCGSSYLRSYRHEFESVNSWGNKNNQFGSQHYTLLIIWLNALTKGVCIFYKEDRIKEFSPHFLHAIFLEYTSKQKYIFTHQLSLEEKIEKGYGMLCESWLWRPSHIESLQSQQLEWVVAKLQAVKSPENVPYLGVSLKEICDILAGTYHGFYTFEIRAYEKNNWYLWDISVYRIPLTLWYDLYIFSPLGKPDELSTLGHSNEMQIICKEIIRFIQTSIHIFSWPEYMHVVHRFETKIPHESPNSIAQWYKRIINKEISSVVFVQQKGKFVPNFPGSPSPYTVVGTGVECLLRFYDPQKDLTFWPGAYPEIGEEKFNPEFWVFEAMNALGIYKKFMHEHLELIFAQMARMNIPFSLNVRGDELSAASYITHLDMLCKEHTIDPARITIEILEEWLDLKNQQVILSIQHFLERGMRISIDDFWSNQSGEVRINGIREIYTKIEEGKFEIKLDTIYTKQLLTNFEYIKWLVATLKLAGATICCEHIEDDAHLAQAFFAGIDTIQGYVFHKPEPVNTFITRSQDKNF
jgi:EAL domain-containing protein (putative c-di-GMP-specific phosphodiesterase class I)